MIFVGMALIFAVGFLTGLKMGFDTGIFYATKRVKEAKKEMENASNKTIGS